MFEIRISHPPVHSTKVAYSAEPADEILDCPDIPCPLASDGSRTYEEAVVHTVG